MSKRNNFIGFSRVPQGLFPFLTAYWTADNIATDVHVNNLGGSFTGANYTTGINGQSFNFGSGTEIRYVDVPDNNLLSFTDGTNDVPFSIRMWVWFDSKSSVGNWLINKRDAAPTANQLEYQFFYNPVTNRFAFTKYSQLLEANRVVCQADVIPANNQWHHLFYTDNGTKFGGKIYLNSVDITSGHVEAGTYVRMINGTNFMRFGFGSFTNVNTDTKHRGRLDEIAIFNGYEATPQQIVDDYNLGVGKFYPNI
jgi:hypothetical protein